MSQVNIDIFMDRFHEFERENNLFADTVDSEPWWDTVRYDVCNFLFESLSNPTCTDSAPARRKRRLGTLRRWSLRQLLFAKATIGRHDLLVFRAPRSIVDGRAHDLAIDPIADMFSARSLSIDTLPRYYHLPEFEPSRWRGTVPPTLPSLIQTLLKASGIEANRAEALDVLIRRVRGEYACHVAGYRRLFDRACPKAVLLVQNGIEKALFRVANERGVPTIEVQHGLIGHGHPSYSYPRDVDYSRQMSLPTLFLTFSEFWQNNCYYPAERREVIGTDHFASSFAPMNRALGTIMVISANIYHRRLFDLTRQLATRLPDRKFIYKLHPNQKPDKSEIQSSFEDLPNVEVGNPLSPASHLMEDVSHLVAAQSTVVYEALQQGRRICIVPYHNYHIHSDIFLLPEVSVCSTVEEFFISLKKPNLCKKFPVFFDQFNMDLAFDLVKSLVDSGSRESIRP